MKLRRLSTTVVLAMVGAVSVITTYGSEASADPRDYTGGTTVLHRSSEFTETTPNVDLIASGLFTFAVPYLASVAVATESNRHGDSYLYTPVAGPWLDLTARDRCPPSGSCGNETTYQILLVANGVLQGFGALEVLSGFMFPVPHSVNSDSSTRVHIAPTVASNRAGLTAFGQF